MVLRRNGRLKRATFALDCGSAGESIRNPHPALRKGEVGREPVRLALARLLRVSKEAQVS
jgi:hypothetical protein